MTDTDLASLSPPSSSCCSAGVYADVGIDQSNRYLYDLLHLRYQTTVTEEPHAVEGTDTETPLESKINRRNPGCHFAVRQSKLMLAWTKAIDNYM